MRLLKRTSVIVFRGILIVIFYFLNDDFLRIIIL